jgi:NhaP-type Na+/H+ or K+/H+ antiporter
VKLSRTYRIIFGISIILVVYSICTWLQANLFLASFTSGIVVATLSSELMDTFREFWETAADLLKLATIFNLGAMVAVSFFTSLSLADYLFAALVIILARPIAIWLSLLGSHMKRVELATAAWFGPRGFASAVYGLYIYQAGVPRAIPLFHIIALVIVFSMIIHSSTDIFFTRWFLRKKEEEQSPEQA